MAEPFSAFPSWFMRITCDRCGKDRMLSETHTPHRDMPIREIIKRMRHDGYGGRAGKGRATDRHRRGQQPPGAEDRAELCTLLTLHGYATTPAHG
jgi:hypothetical protein